MRTFLSSLLACAMSTCALSVTPGNAEAATGIARCAMPDGTHAYTNVACSRLGGRHVALSAEVQNRIRREQRREAELTGMSLPPAGLLAESQRGSRRPKGQGCATSPRELAVDLRASMAQGDVNRIAESFDWAGMRHRQAMRVMAQLTRLGRAALVDAEFFGSTPSAGDGTLQVLLEEAGRQKVADFDVRRHRGCYFLQHRWSA